MSPGDFFEPIPDVVVYEHSVVEGKNAIVFGSTDVLAVDACMRPSEASEMVGMVTARRRRVDYLALTHGHPDHVFGSGRFQDADVIAHLEHDRMVRRSVNRQAARTNQNADELYSSLAHPSTTFEDSVVIDLGGRSVELFHTPGHTPDSICVFIQDDELLIGSDTVVTAIVPAVTDGDSLQLESQLRLLAKRDAAVLVPGHGPVISGRGSVRRAILWSADYLHAVRLRVAEALASGIDDPIAAVPYCEFVGGRFDVENHRMDRRHVKVVQKIVAEMEAL